MINIERALRSDRIMKSLTGVTSSEFNSLTPVFEEILIKESLNKDRERCPGGGSKHTLETGREKLFYILFYIKCYPTFDVAGFFFDVDRSRTCRRTHGFLPVLEKTLGRKCVLPARQIRDADEFIRLFPEISEVFIDGTERRIQRSKNYEKQKENYSGKKKCRTRKNVVVTDSQKRILILTPTEPGKKHDYGMLKETDIPDCLPDRTDTWGDPGFQGMRKDYPHLNVHMPHKKPKGKELSEEQKSENTVISSFRVVVENAIGGIKRLKSLTDVYRNRKKDSDDTLMNIGCGIWNFHLKKA